MEWWLCWTPQSYVFTGEVHLTFALSKTVKSSPKTQLILSYHNIDMASPESQSEGRTVTEIMVRVLITHSFGVANYGHLCGALNFPTGLHVVSVSM
jgi:hypothetical protein